ncbi:unnamed protein product, partial [Cylicocyclus nassatus]
MKGQRFPIFLAVLLLSIACGCFGDLFSCFRSPEQNAYRKALKFCKQECAHYFHVYGTDYYQACYPYYCLQYCMIKRSQTYRRPD